MNSKTPMIASIALIVAGATLSTAADARHHYRHYDRRDDHGRCLRFNKSTGTAAGAVGGALLGNVIAGHGNRTAGTLIGGAAGGFAGHELANNRRKNC